MSCPDCGGELDDFGPHLCDDTADFLGGEPRPVAQRQRAPPTSMRDKARARWADRTPADHEIAQLSHVARDALVAAAAGRAPSPKVGRTLVRRGLLGSPAAAVLTPDGVAVEKRLRERNDSAVRRFEALAGGE